MNKLLMKPGHLPWLSLSCTDSAATYRSLVVLEVVLLLVVAACLAISNKATGSNVRDDSVPHVQGESSRLVRTERTHADQSHKIDLICVEQHTDTVTKSVAHNDHKGFSNVCRCSQETILQLPVVIALLCAHCTIVQVSQRGDVESAKQDDSPSWAHHLSEMPQSGASAV